MSKTTNDKKIFISLPNQSQPIEIGWGTVPTSTNSVVTVSIDDLRKSASEVSKLGIYDTDKQEKTSN
jgi:hypothetical protein